MAIESLVDIDEFDLRIVETFGGFFDGSVDQTYLLE
jgi:hypothetical protein